MRKALIIAALAATALATPASAAMFRTCSGPLDARTCWFYDTGSAEARIIKPAAPLSAEDEEAKAARIRAWESFCKPTEQPGPWGTIRLIYAHPGCEFGRTE